MRSSKLFGRYFSTLEEKKQKRIWIYGVQFQPFLAVWFFITLVHTEICLIFTEFGSLSDISSILMQGYTFLKTASPQMIPAYNQAAADHRR